VESRVGVKMHRNSLHNEQNEQKSNVTMTGADTSCKLPALLVRIMQSGSAYK
jgi:hypothetical protein